MSDLVKNYVILRKYGKKAGCIDLLVKNKWIQKSHLSQQLKIHTVFAFMYFNVIQ